MFNIWVLMTITYKLILNRKYNWTINWINRSTILTLTRHEKNIGNPYVVHLIIMFNLTIYYLFIRVVFMSDNQIVLNFVSSTAH